MEGLKLAGGWSATAGRWAWTHRTLVLAVLAVLLVALAVDACGRAGKAEAALDAAKKLAAEQARARRADVPVVQPVSQAQVDEEAARALAERPELQAAKVRLEKEVGRLRAILVVRGETSPAPSVGPVRPGEPAGGLAGPAVLLRAGDPLKLKLLGVGEEGPAGARALLVSIGVVRVADGQELHRGPLSVPLTSALQAPPAAPCQAALERAWRAGGGGGASTSGWLLSAAASRRLDLWGYRPEVVGTIGAGPGMGFLVANFLF
jgi:hypothetical protein